MMVEILCAVLGGGAMSTEVGGIRFRGKTVRVSQMFLAIDIARFMPVEEFTARMEQLVGMMKTTPAGAGLRRGAGGGRSGVADRSRAVAKTASRSPTGTGTACARPPRGLA